VSGNAPLVSCIIPVFNGARFLGEAIDSVLAQTYRPREVIVVDDGSTDATGDVIARYGERVMSLRQPNRGQAAARNAGLRAAHGALVAFLDADDLWEPAKLTCQRAKLQEDPRIHLCFTRFQNFWVPGLEEEAGRHRGHSLSEPCAAWSVGTLLTQRAVFDEFGPFDDALRGKANMVWFLRAARQGARITVLPEVLMRRRLHHENASRQDPSDRLEWLLPIVKAWRDYQRDAPGRRDTPSAS